MQSLVVDQVWPHGGFNRERCAKVQDSQRQVVPMAPSTHHSGNAQAEHVRRRAEEGSAEAQYNYGRFCYEGSLVDQDYDEAAVWWLEAAKQGHVKARTQLGHLLRGGLGFELEDEQIARRWVEYERSFAEAGDAEAQSNLGRMYEEGRGVDRDESEAERWLRRAAAQGDAEAKLLLKRKNGTRGDLEAQWELALIYLDGQGVSKDEAEAAHWLSLAAQHGHVEAQFRLGQLLIHGSSAVRDSVKGAQWLLSAARLGSQPAARELGDLYREGIGVEADDSDAAHWWRKAAEDGDRTAQYNIGMMFLEGRGVAADVADAVDWLVKAAEQGHSDAQFQVGRIYRDGPAELRSAAKAERWLESAAEQGNCDAQRLLGWWSMQ